MKRQIPLKSSFGRRLRWGDGPATVRMLLDAAWQVRTAEGQYK
jgi:hypothetical protein